MHVTDILEWLILCVLLKDFERILVLKYSFVTVCRFLYKLQANFRAWPKQQAVRQIRRRVEVKKGNQTAQAGKVGHRQETRLCMVMRVQKISRVFPSRREQCQEFICLVAPARRLAVWRWHKKFCNFFGGGAEFVESWEFWSSLKMTTCHIV